jgi:hypothetical protein
VTASARLDSPVDLIEDRPAHAALSRSPMSMNGRIDLLRRACVLAVIALCAVPVSARETRLKVVQKAKLLVENDFKHEYCRVWVAVPESLRDTVEQVPLRAGDTTAQCTMSGQTCNADFAVACKRVGSVTIDVPKTYASAAGGPATRCPPPDRTRNFDCHPEDDGSTIVFVDGGKEDECTETDAITFLGHPAKVNRVDGTTRWITVEKSTCDALEKRLRRKHH